MTGTEADDPPVRRYPRDENEAVLAAVEALAGFPGPGWDAVTVSLERDRLLLRVWVDDADAEREQAEDFAGQVDLLALGVVVELELHEGTPRPYEWARHGRIVYLRRYPDDRAEPGGS